MSKISVNREANNIYINVEGITVGMSLEEARQLRNNLNDNIDQCCYAKNQQEIKSSLNYNNKGESE